MEQNRKDILHWLSVFQTDTMVVHGVSMGAATAIDAVRKSPHPMLFIHGSKDSFVPTEMVHRLYHAKSGKKSLWIADDAGHAESYLLHRKEYVQHVRDFLAH